LQVVRPGYFSFFGNVQGNGLVKLFLKQRKSGDWFFLVRSRGPGILPSFPANPTFFTVVRVGTASFVSTSGTLRDVGHRGLVREFPWPRCGVRSSLTAHAVRVAGRPRA